MSIKIERVTVSFEAKEMQQLAEVLVDEDPQAALQFVKEVVAAKVRCYQYESHKPDFEGGTGKEPAHFLQKGEGHPPKS